MKKEEIIQVLQSCMFYLDGGISNNYSKEFNRELWILGEKLFNYLNKLEVSNEI